MDSLLTVLHKIAVYDDSTNLNQLINVEISTRDQQY